MTTPKTNVITGKDGKPIGVFLDMQDYEAMLDELEELEAIRAYDAAKAEGGEAVSFSDATRSLHR